jgi:hypothetical protein
MPFGFGKAPPPPPGPPSSPPVDMVAQMRQQGMSNNQIVQTLQNQGYDPNLIFDALNQADIRGGVDNMPPRPDAYPPGEVANPMEMGLDAIVPPGAEPPMGPPPQGLPPMDQFMPPERGSSGPVGPGSYGGGQLEAGSLERIEEIAEAIIDEKWNEIVKSVNKIIDWKDRTEQRMVKIEQMITDMKQNYDNLQKGVLGKVGEYDQNLTNIGSEIKAMERVFQEVLPSLTENVHALDKIAKNMKGNKK